MSAPDLFTPFTPASSRSSRRSVQPPALCPGSTCAVRCGVLDLTDVDEPLRWPFTVGPGHRDEGAPIVDALRVS